MRGEASLMLMEFGLEGYLYLRDWPYLIFHVDIHIDAIFSFLNQPESGLGVDYRNRKKSLLDEKKPT